MGKPSATEPWGWQFDGHHMIINYLVLGDQVVMTPFFAGSEPVIAAAGRFKGTSVLQQEQDQGLAFANTLDAAQRGKAILSTERRATTISPRRSRTTRSCHRRASWRRICRMRSENDYSI